MTVEAGFHIHCAINNLSRMYPNDAAENGSQGSMGIGVADTILMKIITLHLLFLFSREIFRICVVSGSSGSSADADQHGGVIL